ncbi:FimV family protein [Thiolapillus brandeum]|nr:FimV family protein [Thiolapillus brandeum]
MSVYALGLGDMTTHSALNEKFKADIALISVKKGQIDTLKATLAPAAVFNRLGVERTLFLSRLKFRPMRLKNGKAVIRVTSSEPIREPFLDFFIKLDWPNGQAVKEYTALLDPPSLTRRRAEKIAAASAQSSGGTAARSGDNQSAARAASRPRRTASDGEYGPVAANETLWEIADDLRPQGISVHQMMMALYKANPQAFLNNNINMLKKGQVLRVPGADEITIGRTEAVAEFQQQISGAIPPAVSESASAATEAAETRAEEATSSEEAGKLQIASATEEPKEIGQAASDLEVEAGSTDLRQQMLILEEQAETARQEATLMRSQVEELQQQLSDTQRLLELKDEELARLQEGMAETNEAEAAVENGASEAESEAETDVSAENPLDEAEEAVEPATEEPATEGAGTEATTPGETVTEEAAVVEETTGDNTDALVETESVSEEADTVPPAAKAETPAAAEEPAAREEAPAVAAQPEPAKEPSLMEDPMAWIQNNMMIAGGAAGALILAILALLLGRRKKEEQGPVVTAAGEMGESVDQESILMEEESSLADTVADHMAAGNIGDTSFLSEYSTEEFKGLQEDTAEVDPVSEADVYIAYGRYQQAEEILREAMDSGNDSAAVKYKMLEVYYATQKKDQFNALAEEMVDSGQYEEDPKAWEHIQTMGRDLDKSNPLFAAGVAAAGADAAAAVSDADSGVGEDSELSLDLSTLAEEVDSALSADSEPLEGFSELDLDFSKLDTDDGATAADDEAAQAESVLDDVNNDDMALGETELHTELLDISDIGDVNVGTTNLDEALADLSGDLEGVMADSQILDEPLDLEDERFSNLEDGLSPDSQISGLEDDLNVSSAMEEDSIIGDEVETKLELARAFMEIGDADGARGILQEVEEDGTPEQKEIASELLTQLKN